MPLHLGTSELSNTVSQLRFVIEDLIKYLDPQYIDRMAVPDAMKLQFILAEEQFILSQVALLEQVNNLQPFLDSAHIKAAPDHAAKLQRLAQIHIQQQVE
uniref:Dynactin subunit 3 n=1 Tax=Terrapene triunguis TaxID=2587831 RepID=A0A674IYR8_9SAUR